MSTLQLLSGPDAGQSVPIDHDLVIGREAGNDVVLDDVEVSRRHAVVRPRGDGVAVEDLGSSNGTFLNGRPIAGEVMLTTSGRLTVGGVEMAIQLEDPAATLPRAEPPPPPPPAPAAPPPPEPSRRRPVVAAAVAGAVLVAGVVAVVLLAGGDSTATHAYRANYVTGLLFRQGNKVLAGGTTTQTPGGKGAVTVIVIGSKPFTGREPVPITGTITTYLDGGRIDARYKGVATPTPQKTTDLAGKGAVVGGSGDFKGAKGSFTFKSSQEPQNPTVGHPKVTGSITY